MSGQREATERLRARITSVHAVGSLVNRTAFDRESVIVLALAVERVLDLCDHAEQHFEDRRADYVEGYEPRLILRVDAVRAALLGES